MWQDRTINPASPGGDILFRASSDNGATFGGLKKLDATPTNLDSSHQISASSKNISVAWSDNAGNVDYISSVYSPIEVQFSAAQYSLNATATVTVTDPTKAGAGTISVKVNSTADGTGFTKSFTETGGGTGIFTGQISFGTSTVSGSSILKAISGNIIYATYSGQQSIASILPVTIAFDSPAGYDRGAISHVTITDRDANLDPATADKITVHLSSTANPTGIDLQLTETGVNTGVFGSTSSDKLIFMDTNNLFPSTGTVTITQTNTGANLNPNAIETVSEQVNSTSDAVGITMNLNETGVNTGIFSGRLTLGSSSINHIAIKVAPGDFVRVTRGTATENALITPNPNSSNGALLVTADPSVDTVTASYKGVTKNVSVSRLFNPGGSGGGLVRPGLVLNALAGLAHGDSGSVSPSFDLSNFAAVPGALPDNIKLEVLNQDPLKPIPPSHDSSFNFPFYIGDNGYPLAHYTNTLSPNIIKTGDPVQVKLNIPATGLVHVALYTDIHGTVRDVYHSDTYIIYDKGQPLQVVDPHGFFAPHTGFDLTTVGANNAISFKITFAKPMEESDIDLRAWNDHQSSSETKILDAWQVEPSSSTLSSQIAPATTSTITPATTVPSTTTPMQNTAPTTETTPDLMPAIKDWGGYSPNPISDSDLLAKIGIQGQHIPSWVAKTTKWVVDGNVTPQEFENLVKYLASAGIVK